MKRLKIKTRTNFVYAAICERKEIFTDITGAFPVTSTKGNKYIFILYAYDQNAILSQPMKNRTKSEIKKAYQTKLNYLQSRGLHPWLQRLDNEASAELKDFMRAEDIDYQLVLPHVHRRNAAERAIQTFKNHFISNLHGCDKDFPAYAWSESIPQCEMTLNMLRRSRINPKLSAYTQMFGMFDYNKTPLAPLGTKSLTHERPKQRRTFADHG